MHKLLLVSIPLLFFISCKQEDLTPSYLRIDAIDLSTNGTSEGDNSNGIVDAWIYIDNKAIGVFELPCVVPILEEGDHQILIYAGIKNNGISDKRIRYPFYERYESTITLVKNDTLLLTPSVSYKSNVKMELLEDFEDAGIELVSYGLSDTAIQFVNDPAIVKYGDKCGGIFLSGTDTVMLSKTINNLILNRNENVYVEMDFRNDNTFAIGVIARNSTSEVENPVKLILNPQTSGEEVWKKLYLDIEDEVSYQLEATSYGIYIISTVDEGNTAANIYIDNIKVVRYQ